MTRSTARERRSLNVKFPYKFSSSYTSLVTLAFPPSLLKILWKKEIVQIYLTHHFSSIISIKCFEVIINFDRLQIVLYQHIFLSWLENLFLLLFIFRLLSVLCSHSFFHPHHNGQWRPTSKDFYPRFYPLHFLS